MALLACFLAFAIRRLLLLLTAGEGLGVARLLLGGPSGRSHKDVGVGFLQLVQHFLPVLCLRKAALERLN